MHILLIKMSSMGDLVHNCPVVSDIMKHFPEAQIDWVAEEAYQAIPKLHSGVRKVIPIAWRRWRKSLIYGATQQEIFIFRAQLQAELYDLVIDTQGLFKSAIVGKMANSGGIVGGDFKSIKEGFASFFYDKRLPILKSRHVIDRCRAVAAGALGYAIDDKPFYGIRAKALAIEEASWLQSENIAENYAVLMQAASRPEKLWAEENWLAIGKRLQQEGIYSILPWGNLEEKARAQILADKIGNAIVPPFMELDTAARFLAGAKMVIGLDTGLTHFAAALGRPTIGIFCDSDSEQAAVSGDGFCQSFGKKGNPPELSIIEKALEEILAMKND